MNWKWATVLVRNKLSEVYEGRTGGNLESGSAVGVWAILRLTNIVCLPWDYSWCPGIAVADLQVVDGGVVLLYIGNTVSKLCRVGGVWQHGEILKQLRSWGGILEITMVGWIWRIISAFFSFSKKPQVITFKLQNTLTDCKSNSFA